MKREHTTRSIGEDQAIKLHESKFWEKMSYRERAGFQLFVDELCMPFDVFHEAVEKSLGRPVWTHEFGLAIDQICDEFLGNKGAPTMKEIIGLIPEHKRIVVVKPSTEGDQP